MVSSHNVQMYVKSKCNDIWRQWHFIILIVDQIFEDKFCSFLKWQNLRQV